MWRALPPTEREQATLLAGNYGEAGAVDRYGASFGLPQVYSGANNYWLWGPPPAGDTAAVVISVDPAAAGASCAASSRTSPQVAVYRNGLNVADDEQGAAIFVATGLRTSWAAAWPAFRNYSVAPLAQAVAAGGSVVAGQAGQLGEQPRRGQHLAAAPAPRGRRRARAGMTRLNCSSASGTKARP